MRIAIISPLFPPDVAVPAPYVKELATRLARIHEVTVLTYNHIPEAVPGVRMTVIEKQERLFIRLYRFTTALWSLSRQVDVVIIQNGISTELPALLISLVRKMPIIIETSDPKVIEQNKRSALKRIVHKLLCHRTRTGAADTVLINQLNRPEIFSFRPYPTEAFATYEAAWKAHLEKLNQQLTAYVHTK